MRHSATLTREEIAHCVAAVKEAAPHLRRASDQDFMLLLDGLRPNLLLAYNQLEGLERAEYAVGIWRYCRERGLFGECLNMVLHSGAVTADYPFALKMEGCTAIGAMCQRLALFDMAEDYLQYAWRIAQFLDAPCDKAFVRHQLGLVYWQKGELETSLEHHNASLKIAEQTDDTWIIAANYNAFGVIALANLRLEEADKWFAESTTLFESLKECKRAIEGLINRGIVAGELGKFDLAEQAYRRCLQMCKVLNDPSMYALCLLNLGDICTYTNKIDEARTTLTSGYEQILAMGNKLLLPNAIQSLGRVCYLEGNYKKAVCLFSAAEYFREQCGAKTTCMEQNEPAKMLRTIRQHMRPQTVSRYWNQGKRINIDELLSWLDA